MPIWKASACLTGKKRAWALEPSVRVMLIGRNNLCKFKLSHFLRVLKYSSDHGTSTLKTGPMLVALAVVGHIEICKKLTKLLTSATRSRALSIQPVEVNHHELKLKRMLVPLEGKI